MQFPLIFSVSMSGLCNITYVIHKKGVLSLFVCPIGAWVSSHDEPGLALLPSNSVSTVSFAVLDGTIGELIVLRSGQPYITSCIGGIRRRRARPPYVYIYVFPFRSWLISKFC